MSLVILIFFYCLLSPVNNLTVSLPCRSYIIMYSVIRLKKAIILKSMFSGCLPKNLFSIIQITESSEEKKLLPSFGL